MDALVLDAEGRTARVHTISRPTPSEVEVLIRVENVALNPVDSLYVYNPLGSSGRTVGSDFAGIVSQMGDGVPTTCGLQPGDRVAGFVQGACSMNKLPGAFAEYVLCPYDLVWKVPETMSLGRASTVSLCGLTAAQALFYRMGLPGPFQHLAAEEVPLGMRTDQGPLPVFMFIYGASTSVAMYAAQLVQHVKVSSGMNVVLIGTASPKHFELLKRPPFMFDHVLDYHDSQWPDQVYRFTNNAGLDYAYDCISEGNTVQNISRIMKETGKLCVVRSKEGGAWYMTEERRVEPSYGAVWEGLGEDVLYQGMTLPANSQARRFAVAFHRWLSTTGGLQPNNTREMPGGLSEIVSDGFQLLGSGSMSDRTMIRTESWMQPLSAEKLVYRVHE